MLELFIYYSIIVYLHKGQKELCITITMTPFLWKTKQQQQKTNLTEVIITTLGSIFRVSY